MWIFTGLSVLINFNCRDTVRQKLRTMVLILIMMVMMMMMIMIMIIIIAVVIVMLMILSAFLERLSM